MHENVKSFFQGKYEIVINLSSAELVGWKSEGKVKVKKNGYIFKGENSIEILWRLMRVHTIHPHPVMLD